MALRRRGSFEALSSRTATLRRSRPKGKRSPPPPAFSLRSGFGAERDDANHPGFRCNSRFGVAGPLGRRWRRQLVDAGVLAPARRWKCVRFRILELPPDAEV